MNENTLDYSYATAQDKLYDTWDIEANTDNGAYASVSGGDSIDSGYSNISIEGGPETANVVPVMVVKQVDNSFAVGTGNGYQLPTYYVEYFKGVLNTLGDTNYLAFCTREYYNNYNYTEHYRLVYDIALDNDNVVVGYYPCLDIFRDSNNNYYNVSDTTYELTEIPSFSYGNFSKYSDMREGMTHETSYTLLFFLGFFAVYTVCHDIYDYIMDKVYRR